MIRFDYHYQERESYYQVPCILYMIILLLVDLPSLRQAYSSYARYIVVIISFFGMLMMGKYTYRVRPVFSIALLGISNLILLKAIFAKTGGNAAAVANINIDRKLDRKKVD